ncbi:MAG: Tad domain-containing protein [Selenomonadaceae bacterium]|nr:Tad domain-containing protein [Selenomonadaceae bacterium]
MKPLNDSRGQVSLLYALLVPILLFMGGVGLDLGWYYMNVSRLQNAADAAVLVGANKLIAEHDTFKDKNYKARLVDKYPADSPAYDTTDNLTKSTSGKLIDTSIGDKAALDYAKKNLAGSDMGYALPSLFSVAHAEDDTINSYAFKDGYTRGDPTVMMTPSLWQDGDGNYYYVLHLTERIHHFFVGFLGDMESPVVAVALISQNNSSSGDSSSDTPTEITLNFDTNGGKFDDDSTTDSKTLNHPDQMEDDDTTDPIESEKGTPTYTGKVFKGWSTSPTPNEDGTVDNFIADGKQLTKTELQALFGDSTEITLYAVWVDDTSSSDSSSGSDSSSSSDTPTTAKPKPHNNRTLWEQMHYLIAKYVYDPDWNVSVNKFGAALNDLNFIPTGNAAVLKNNKIVYIDMGADTKANNSGAYVKDVDRLFLDFRPDGFIVRVHALIKVNAAYDVRSAHVGKDDDPLYIRIEAEPKVGSTGNEPQQIIININADNTADSKRPLFFYYDGPLDYNGTYPDRVAQPVILNLTTDFKGVLWMPEVPVVIHGNGKTFEGFIVAKEFRYISTSGKQIKYTNNNLAAYYYIDANNNIQTIAADGDNALELYGYNAEYSSRFNLNSNSKFRTFKAETDVNFMYVYYDYNCVMDSSPFYLNTGDLIPLYKLDANGKQVRVTKWDDVNLYDSNNTNTRNLIPKTVTDTSRKGTVRLTNGSPSPLYDEAGNPVYFCEDYVNLTGTYEVFTLDRVADGTRNPKEFLLTKTDALNVPNTDDWR